MKYALILILALVSQVSTAAQIIHCPGIGELYPDGEQMFLAYNEKLGFSERTDTAYLIKADADSADYRVSKWGALLTIPAGLLNGSASGRVEILQPETAWQAIDCTSEAVK